MPKFNRKVEADEDGVYETWTNRAGTEHFGNFTPYDDDDYDQDEGESLSVEDAALIWRSNGEDEDYTFGYSEDALRDASKR